VVSVEKIVDGDTAHVRRVDTGELLKVRFQGIDAPEKRQPGGMEARAQLVELLTGADLRQVLLREHGRDKYRRVLGTLYVSHVSANPLLNVNLEMVRRGYAWHYRQYSDDAELAAAEQEARAAGRGIFAHDAQAPWEWRRARRGK
jgi:endonuclease YncB( thermonuclease family)